MVTQPLAEERNDVCQGPQGDAGGHHPSHRHSVSRGLTPQSITAHSLPEILKIKILSFAIVSQSLVSISLKAEDIVFLPAVSHASPAKYGVYLAFDRLEFWSWETKVLVC